MAFYALLFFMAILIYSAMYEETQRIIPFKFCNECNICYFVNVLRCKRFALKHAFVYHTLTSLQSVDNYFVYVISNLISAFAYPAEYLRYDETVSTRSRLKQKPAFILRHAQTQFIHTIYELCSGLITLTS